MGVQAGFLAVVLSTRNIVFQRTQACSLRPFSFRTFGWFGWSPRISSKNSRWPVVGFATLPDRNMQKPKSHANDITEHGYEPAHGTAVAEPKVSLWRKLGGGSLTISILMHAIILGVGVFWVFRVIAEPKQDDGFLPTGGGASSGVPRAALADLKKKKQAVLMPTSSPKRSVNPAATSGITLPPQEDDSFGEMSPLNGLSRGGMPGGLGGTDGLGGNQSHGVNSVMNSSLCAGGNKNLFGLVGATNNRLTGYIYDFTQLSNGKPSAYKAKYGESNCAWLDPLVSQFVKRGFPESMLEKYYRGPEKLGVHQILIPCSKDNTAPKAFGAEGKMSGGAWVIVYKGRVCAPETGEIRFCGTADNYLGVRFDHKNVLYYASGGQALSEIELSPTKAIPGLRLPIAEGRWQKVEKGKWYDMEILIGDAGGVFSAVMYYERKGDEGHKIAFRTESLPWDEVMEMDGKFYAGLRDLPRDIDPQSPVWQCKPGSALSF